MSQLASPQRIVIGFRLVDALRDLLDGVGAYVRANGLKWQIQCLDAKVFPMLLRRATADGAITQIDPRARQQVRQLKRVNVPTVNMLRDLSPHFPSVLSDNRGFGRLAPRDFLGRGFRKFGFVGFNTVWSAEREAGF